MEDLKRRGFTDPAMRNWTCLLYTSQPVLGIHRTVCYTHLSYDLIYACYGVKNGELKSEAGGFKYFTSADIGSYWNNLNTELEAIPINESELP